MGRAIISTSCLRAASEIFFGGGVEMMRDDVAVAVAAGKLPRGVIFFSLWKPVDKRQTNSVLFGCSVWPSSAVQSQRTDCERVDDEQTNSFLFD